MAFCIETFNDFNLALNDKKHIAAMGDFTRDKWTRFIFKAKHVFFDGACIFVTEKIEDIECSHFFADTGGVLELFLWYAQTVRSWDVVRYDVVGIVSWQGVRWQKVLKQQC